MTEDVVEAVCQLHMDAFETSPSTRLGARYVRRFVSWFQQRRDGIALVAQAGDAVVGYVIGAPVGYTAALNRSLAVIGTLSVLTSPSLWVDPRTWGTIIARVGFVLGQSGSTNTGLPEPVMSLVGIAVASEARGKRVGAGLVNAFEERARELGMASLRLSVYPDNRSARCLYERCGWHALPAAPSASGAIYYGRVL